MDIVVSLQPHGPTIEPGSDSLSFHCSLISTDLMSKGSGGGGGGLQVYLLCNHCLASLGLTWAERGMGERHISKPGV